MMEKPTIWKALRYSIYIAVIGCVIAAALYGLSLVSHYLPLYVLGFTFLWLLTYIKLRGDYDHEKMVRPRHEGYQPTGETDLRARPPGHD